MKHIQKIVKMALVLKSAMGWKEDEIGLFITEMSNYTSKLRYCNEALIGQNKPYSVIEERQRLENEAFNYMEMMLPAFSQWEFSHNVLECPIKIYLGKEYANYEDNKSFVIDL